MSILSNILPKTGLSQYYSRKDNYEQKITKSFDLQQILSLYNNTEGIIPVPNNIQAFDIPLGNSARYVRRKMGTPLLEYKCDFLKERKIFIYKSRFLKNRVLTQFHFYNNKLFIVENHFYSLNNMEQKILQKIFAEKYKLQSTQSCNDYKLQDTKGNKLIVSKDIYISMIYLYNNAEILNDIQEKNNARSINNINQYQQHLSGWMKRI